MRYWGGPRPDTARGVPGAGDPIARDLRLSNISGMDGITLTPDLERFAVEAVASGRYRDLSEVVAAGVSLLQRTEVARAALLASVIAAQEEGDRTSYLTADDLVARVEARLAGRPSSPG